jgi:hypothetical protein
MWCKVDTSNKQSVFLGLFYRPHDTDAAYIESLYKSCEMVRDKSNGRFILLGDFNVPNIDWNDVRMTQYSALADSLVNFTLCNGLSQHVLETTRFSSSDSVLDLIFTSDDSLIKDVRVTAGISDHEAVCFSLVCKPKLLEKIRANVQVINDTNSKLFCDMLQSNDWSKVFSSDDIENVWENWKMSFFDVMNKCIPTKSFTIKNTRNHSCKWITREVKLLKRKEHRAYKTFKRKRSHTSRKKYLQCRKKVQLHMKKAEHDYISNMCDDLQKKPKPFWQFVNSKRCDTNVIGTLKQGDNVLTCDIDKAKCLNEQFQSVFNKCTNDCDIDFNDINDCPMYTEDDIFNEEEVMYELLKLDGSKSCGPDGIKPRILKIAAKELASPLCRLFNLSYSNGKLPSDWSIANISPLYKRGTKSDPKNYRPVSLTSIICKLMEKLVRKRLTKHLDKYDLIIDNQHGFRSKRSCETQLLQSIHDWSEILEKSPVLM